MGSGVGERLTPGVRAVPVTDLPGTTLALGRLKGATRPEVTAFVRAAQSVMAGHARGPAAPA
ncbi:hypothetical protein E4K10_41535 [Streptomyces sp. T1317-0309]|nr:hypothetical protein E4K10_41535 [Streptomyces sp. T1317-0309]